MSVLVVGTTALDSIKTPTKENPRLLGGSGSHAAVAASFFSPVKLIGVVGADFPRKYIALYEKLGIDLAGLQRLPGKTFHWSGEYEANMNNRRTLATELGVIETFQPKVPAEHRNIAFVLLANMAPAVQHAVLDQMRKPRFVVADSMDLWINIALPDLLRLLKRLDGFVLNDGEAHMLTKEDNLFDAIKKLHKLGPKYVIIKQGSHGSILSGPKGFFICPAYPLPTLEDPTGAGDSFVGGMMGCLAAARGSVEANIRRAMVYGSVTASFCCEGFGVLATIKTKRSEIEKRVKELEKMTGF